jgi:hypothetical protein
VNEGVDIPPRGQSSPLGANHVVKNWPQVSSRYRHLVEKRTPAPADWFDEPGRDAIVDRSVEVEQVWIQRKKNWASFHPTVNVLITIFKDCH